MGPHVFVKKSNSNTLRISGFEKGGCRCKQAVSNIK